MSEEEQIQETLKYAAANGFLYVIKKFWILDEFVDGVALLKEAGVRGHLTVVQYLVEEESVTPKGYLDDMVCAAVVNGWNDLLKYYHDNTRVN